MNGAKVLVVDDDESFRDLMASHLKRHGYAVEVASGGAEALGLFRERGPFSVLVTDLSMPVMDGLELMAHARQLDPWLEVVIITAAGSMEAAISALHQDGAYDFLIKPLESINQLSLSVWRAAAHRQLRVEKERLQARLAAEAERLRALIGNVSDSIVASDAQGIISVANAAAQRLLGHEDLVGQEAAQALPQPLAAPLQEWLAVGGARPSAVEVSWPAGAVQRVSLSRLPPSDQDSDGWVMVVSDITHLRQAEELKRRLFAEAADQIRQQVVQAETEMQALRELAQAPAAQRQDVEGRLAGKIAEVRAWVDGLPGFVDVDRGRALKPVGLDLVRFIRAHLQEWSAPPAGAQAVPLDLKAPESGSKVWVDRDLMGDVLRRLVALAARQAEAGAALSIVIQHYLQHLWIEVVEEAPSGGAPSAAPAAAVDSWIAAEEAGIDAALVREMVARMGGQVWFRPSGRGSGLAVSLPRAEA